MRVALLAGVPMSLHVLNVLYVEPLSRSLLVGLQWRQLLLVQVLYGVLGNPPANLVLTRKVKF